MTNRYFNKNLELIIYTTGYHKEGESILILIKSDNITVFSIVIDSYEENDINITYQLLQEEKIDYIDIVCWSHPDLDHSKGISKFLEWIDYRTTIVIGDGFYETKKEWETASPEMYNYIVSTLEKDLRIKKRTKIRKVSTGMHLKSGLFVDARTGIEHEFEISAFAPSDFENLQRNIKNMPLKKNNISVGLVIKLSKIVGVFSADIPNVVFNELTEEDFPKLVDYIKIPHHGSESSGKILRLFSNQPKVSCTTVNVANNLQTLNIINQYKTRVENLYCTNDLRAKEQQDFWGLLKTTFHIDIQTDIKNEVYGNAKLIL